MKISLKSNRIHLLLSTTRQPYRHKRRECDIYFVYVAHPGVIRVTTELETFRVVVVYKRKKEVAFD